MLKLNNPHMMYQPVLLHGAGYNPHAYKAMSGDGIGSLFKAFSKGISRVFSKLVPAVSSSAKNLARSTATSVANAGKKYIRDNKGDLLNLANQAKKAGINIATEAGASALSDIISGENVVEVAKKRSSQALRQAQTKASEQLSSGELAQQRRKIGDLLRQEKIRGIQKAQQELKNVESSVINTIVEEQNEIQNEVRESANDLLNRLGIRRGQGLTQIGVRRKGRGLKQIGTGKGKGLKQIGTGKRKKKYCEKCNVSVRDMTRHKKTKKHNRA